MTKTRNLWALLALVCLIGCQTLYTATISITSVVDSAMKTWASMSVAGKTTPTLDARVIAAHDTYRASCGVAQRALITYKAGGDQQAYIVALQATKIAADGLFEILYPLFTAPRAQELKTQLAKANVP